MYHDPIERTATWAREHRRDTTVIELKISFDATPYREFMDAMLLKIKDSLGLTYEEMKRDFLP